MPYSGLAARSAVLATGPLVLGFAVVVPPLGLAAGCEPAGAAGAAAAVVPWPGVIFSKPSFRFVFGRSAARATPVLPDFWYWRRSGLPAACASRSAGRFSPVSSAL